MEGEDLSGKKTALLEKPRSGKKFVDLLTACVLDTHGVQLAKKKETEHVQEDFVPMVFTDSEAGTPVKEKGNQKKAMLAEAKACIQELLDNPPQRKRKAETWLNKLEDVRVILTEIGTTDAKVQEIWTADVKSQLKKQRKAAQELVEQ